MIAKSLRRRPGSCVEPGRIVFTLPYVSPPMRANDRAHWRKKAAQTAGVRASVAALAHGVKPIGCPVTVHLVWYVTDRRRRDQDGPYPTLKAALDGLVDAGLIPDDDRRTVVRSWCEIRDSDGPGVDLVVEEA